MTKRHQRQSDGLYHINGKTYKILRGTRAQVYHSTAFQTPGLLDKSKLMMNKHGRIVSRKKTQHREERTTPFECWLWLQKRSIRARWGPRW